MFINCLILLFFIFFQLSVPSSTEKTDLDLELSSIHGSQTSQQIEVIYPETQMSRILYQMNILNHKHVNVMSMKSHNIISELAGPVGVGQSAS